MIAVSASGFAGCAHVDIASHINKQPAIPVPVPKIKIDEPASMMALKYLSNQDVPKLDVIRGLDEYWNKAAVPVEGGAIPARLIVEAKSGGPRQWNALISNELIAIFTAGALFLFGVPTGWDTQLVTFTIELDGHEYKATAQAKCLAGLYYPDDPGPCAFSRALTDAVRQVARQVGDAYMGVVQGGLVPPDTTGGFMVGRTDAGVMK